MPTTTLRTDAVVVGAGTAGANAAYQLARRGLQVVLLERRPADRGGAQWTNGVLDWQFERADLAPPSGPERVDAHGTTHIVGPRGEHAVTLTSPTVTADMGLLGRRLRALAVDAGVEVVDRAEHLSAEVIHGRLTAVEAVRSGDATPTRTRFEAPLFVDASGRRGVLRQHVPTLAPWCPTVRGDELCTAADVHLHVTDPDGARRFLDRNGARPGETVTAVGVAGGFSTCAVTVTADLDHARVLVGCLANGRYGTGPRMLDDLRGREPWLGEQRSGGFGVIPLRRPYARFTAPGLALVGDAACQVFPAHGSGIGLGLIAGRLLADAAAGPAGAGDPGGEQVLWDYQAAFQREFGGVLLSSDVFRRLSTGLGATGVQALIAAGLMTEPMARSGLDQQWPEPEPAELASLAGRLARAPGLARRMLPRLASGQLAGHLAASYPEQVDVATLTRWDRRAQRLLGDLPR